MLIGIWPDAASALPASVRMRRMVTSACLAMAAVSGVFLCGAISTAAQANGSEPAVEEAPPPAKLLDTGFRELYELNFKGARTDFVAYENLEPDDPLGVAAEAASYLY